MKAMGSELWICLAAVLAAGCAGPTRSTDAASRSVRQGMAEQAAARGDWSLSFQISDSLVRDDREDAAALVIRARAMRHMGMLPEAETDLRQVVGRNPYWAQAHGELGVVLELSGRTADALVEHQEAQRLAPDDPRWLNNLAFALMLRGKPRDAIPLLEKAMRVEPASPILRNNLGFALAATGDYGRAAQQFRYGGPEAAATNNLACAYERGANMPQAFELYAKAVRLDPTLSRARANLEHAAAVLGRTIPDVPGQPATKEEGRGGI